MDCSSHVQCVFEVDQRDVLEEGLIHKLLPHRFEVQAWNPQLKFLHCDTPRCGSALVDHFSIWTGG